MAKKRYNVMLDEETAEKVKADLKAKGLTFSGFVNGLMGQYDYFMKMPEVPEKFSEMKVADVMALFQKMMRALTDEEVGADLRRIMAEKCK